MSRDSDANNNDDNRKFDLHDHGTGLKDHGVASVKAHGTGLADHGQGLGAHAYATGKDVLFKPGAESRLPHEAWHVVQQ